MSNRNISYTFTTGKYRAKVRTKYKDEQNVNQTVESEPVVFYKGQVVHPFRSDSSIIIDIDNCVCSNANLVDESVWGPSNAYPCRIYDNGVAILYTSNGIVDVRNMQTDINQYYPNVKYIYLMIDETSSSYMSFGGWWDFEEIVLGGKRNIMLCPNLTIINNLMTNSNYYLKYLDLSRLDLSNIEQANEAFTTQYKLIGLDLNFNELNNVSSAREMFEACSSLTTLDLSDWDVSNISGNGFAGMFSNCSSLEYLDLNNWDMSRSTYIDAGYFFGSCESLSELHCPLQVPSNADYVLILPHKMYDSQGNEYTNLPGGNITLYKENPTA